VKTWLPWVILALVIAAGIYLYGQERADRAALSERLKAADAKNDAYAVQIAGIAAEVDASEKARLAADAAAQKREAWFQAQLSKTATATPQQLVDDGSRLLRATDISTDGKTVSMGLETWRGAVSIMLNEEEYRTQREPAWLMQAKGYGETIAGLKEQVIAYQGQVAGLEATQKDLSKALNIQRALSTFEKVAYAAAGFGAGMLTKTITK
jgi:hypothetical protein